MLVNLNNGHTTKRQIAALILASSTTLYGTTKAQEIVLANHKVLTGDTLTESFPASLRDINLAERTNDISKRTESTISKLFPGILPEKELISIYYIPTNRLGKIKKTKELLELNKNDLPRAPIIDGLVTSIYINSYITHEMKDLFSSGNKIESNGSSIKISLIKHQEYEGYNLYITIRPLQAGWKFGGHSKLEITLPGDNEFNIFKSTSLPDIKNLSAVLGHRIISNLQADLLNQEMEEAIYEFVAGIDTAKELFSINPLESILLLDDEDVAAGIDIEYPRQIQVSHSLLAKRGARRITGFHEMIHVIDLALDLSGGIFEEKYHRIPRNSPLSALAEGKFLPGGILGHPTSNHRELLATLMNSLNHPDWEHEIALRDNDFRKAYFTCLSTFHYRLDQLKNSDTLSGKEPIYLLIQSKLESLDNSH